MVNRFKFIKYSPVLLFRLGPSILLRIASLICWFLFSALMAHHDRLVLFGEIIFLNAGILFLANFSLLGAEYDIFNSTPRDVFANSLLSLIIAAMCVWILKITTHIIDSYDTMIVLVCLIFSAYLKVISLGLLKSNRKYEYILYDKFFPQLFMLIILLLCICCDTYIESELFLCISLISVFIILFLRGYLFFPRFYFSFNKVLSSFKIYWTILPYKSLDFLEQYLIKRYFGLSLLAEYNIVSRFPKLLTLISEAVTVEFSQFLSTFRSSKFERKRFMLFWRRNVMIAVAVGSISLIAILLLIDYLHILWPGVQFHDYRWIIIILFFGLTLDIAFGPQGRVLIFLGRSKTVYFNTLIGFAGLTFVFLYIGESPSLLSYALGLMVFYVLSNGLNYLALQRQQ